MPTKRRQRVKGRGKYNRSKDMSEEDMDSQDELNDITDQMAKKRLVKSSTDTEVEQQEQKENHRRQHGGDGYDADFESSGFDSTSAGSDMDCQTQPSKPESSRNVLSLSQGRNKRSTGSTQGKLQKKVVLRQSRQSSRQDSISSNQATHSQPNSYAQGRRQSKRKTCSTDSTGQPSIPTDPASLLKSPDLMFSLPNGSDSSTPLSGAADSKSEANDSCFGFEGLLSPPQQQPLLISPVLPESPSHPVDSFATSPPMSGRREETPPPSPSPSLDLVLRLSPSPERPQPSSISSSMYSSVASMASASGRSEATSRGRQKRKLDVNLTGLVQKDEGKGPPKKAVKKKKIQKKKEEDAWTLKMSAEFDDIEMFELTVE